MSTSGLVQDGRDQPGRNPGATPRVAEAFSTRNTFARSSLPRQAVGELAEDVQVTGMSSGLLHHVRHDPPHRG